ncbi:MAG: sulfite exporter TauE/SafE family protein [Hyphomicrobiaceae bacterium]
MDPTFLIFIVVGFLAQLVDGALGMAFGVISTTALLTFGFSPAHASAIVHTAEVFTTASSAISHAIHRNLNRKLVLELAMAGVAGAIVGAYVLSNIDGRIIRPFVAAYLLVLGLSILLRALHPAPEQDISPAFATPLGVIGGFLDAIGGGGWGAIVTSTLIGSGHAPRMVIGSVNIAEFFVTVAAAATFFVQLGPIAMQPVLGLVIGGVIAAPLGAYVVKRLPARPLMATVGLLVIGLSAYQIAKSFGSL